MRAPSAVKTVKNSEQKKFLEKTLFFELLKHIVDVDTTELSIRRAGHIHQLSTLLVLFCL